MKNQNYCKFLFCLFFIISPISVNAEATESLMEVTATIAPSCTITASNLNFGPYNYAISNEIAQIAVLCTKGTNFKISLNYGQGPGATVNGRYMINKNNKLRYLIYQDPAMSKLLGNDNLSSLSDTGTGKEEHIKIYGRILPNQKIPAGFYSDDVLISLSIDGFAGIGYQMSIGMKVITTIIP